MFSINQFDLKNLKSEACAPLFFEIFSTLLMLLFLMTIPAPAEAQSGVSGSYSVMDKITLGAEKGTDFLPINNSIYGDVSTFTGQFQYNIPIATLEGRSGSNLTFSIHYSSSEFRKKANLTNKNYQPSWVGFGWQGSLGHIASDRNNTFDFKDDEYTFVDEAGHSFRLIQREVDPDLFLLEEFKNWKIERIINSTTDELSHWEITREDGRMFIYGNMDSGATSYSLRIGNNAANPSGPSEDYQKNLYQWSLYKITDASGNNTFTLSYQQEMANLIYGITVSDTAYTRATYLKRITAPDGRYLEFELEDRQDFENSWAPWHHDFFKTKRLSLVTKFTANGVPIQKVILKYDYLNALADSTLKKSILSSVQIKSADGSDSLPPYQFIYDVQSNSENFGAITSVVEPIGTIKEPIFVTDTEYSLTRLDSMAIQSVNENENVRLQISSFTDNIAVFVFRVNVDAINWYDVVRILYWNGKWNHLWGSDFGLTEGASWDYGQEVLVGTGGNYAVITNHERTVGGPDSLIILNIVDGYLKETRVQSEYSIGAEGCYDDLIEAGPDFFILRHQGTPGCTYLVDEPFSGWTYYWDGKKWSDAEAWNNETPSDHLYIERFTLSEKSYLEEFILRDTNFQYFRSLDFGAWKGGVLQKNQVTETYDITGATGAANEINQFAVYYPFAAFFLKNSINPKYGDLYLWEMNSQSVWENTFILANRSTELRLKYVKDLFMNPNYLAWHFKDEFDPSFSEIKVIRNIGQGWVEGPSIDLSNHFIHDIQFSAHTIAVCGQIAFSSDLFVWTYTWNGSAWIWKELFRGGNELNDIIEIRLSNNTIAYRLKQIGPPCAQYQERVWVSRYQGTDESVAYWSPPELLFGQCYDIGIYGEFAFDVQDDRVMVFGRLPVPPAEDPEAPWYTARIFDYFGGIWNESVLDIGDMADENLKSLDGFGLSRNNYYLALFGENPHPSITDSVTVFKTGHSYMGKHEGLAQQTLVEEVRYKENSNEINPISVYYNYENVIKDPTDNYTKVNITTVSKPVRSAETAYYSNYHHFNDIPGLGGGDLEDRDTYGTLGGGYQFDGLRYKTESENVARDFTSDYTIKTFKVDSLINGIYWTHVDSEIVAQDGIEALTTYEYDETFHQPVKTTFSIPDRNSGTFVISDSIKYAHESNGSMASDNAISQPGEILKLEGSTVRNKKVYSYGLHSHWQSEKQKDSLDIPADTIITRQSQVWDSYGNALQFQDALGVATSIIYDEDDVRPIAVVSNSYRSDCALLSFEQGDGWDGWNYWLTTAVLLTTEDAFTGNSSLKIVDDIQDPGKSLGPWRSIEADSLTDSLYHVSAWVKSNNPCVIYVGLFDYDDIEPTINHELQFTTETPVEIVEWVFLDTTFAITRDLGADTLHHIKIHLVSMNGTFDTNYAFIDDLRFHPEKSLMTSVTYDPLTKLVTSESDENNVPVRFEYDKLQRLVSTRDYVGELLESRQYYFKYYNVQSDHLDSVVGTSYPFTILGEGDDSALIEITQEVSYVLTVPDVDNSPTPDPSWSRVYLNDVLIEELYCPALEDPCSPLETSGTFFANVGDSVFVRVHGGGFYGGTASGKVYYIKKGQLSGPDSTNFVKTTVYRSNSDSSEIVNFYNGLGKKIQTRQSHESATLVFGKEYDSRGRIWKEYKPYYDTGPSSGVLDFDLPSNLVTEVNAYYDSDGPGPDCGGYPYKEYIYEESAKNRLLAIRYEGSFKDYPDTFVYSLNSSTIDNYGANTLYKSDIIDENGNLRTSYTDRLGREIRYDADPAGINAISSIYPNFHGLDTLVVQPMGQYLRKAYNNQGWLLFDSSGDFGTENAFYDQRGNLRFKRSATDFDAGRFRFFKYDELSRLIAEGIFTDSTEMTWENSFDNNFPNLNSSDSLYTKVTASYDYDDGDFSKGRLVKDTRYPSGDPDSASWSSYKYDAKGRIVEMGSFVYPIDDYTGERISNAEYNLSDQLAHISYPNGEAVNYTYNLAGQQKQVEDESDPITMKVALNYWPTGKLKTKHLGAGASIKQTVDYQYNVRDWLTTINDGNVSSQTTGTEDHYSLALTYDDLAFGLNYNGNVTTYKIKVSPGTLTKAMKFNFGYDNLDRMTLEHFDETMSIKDDSNLYIYDKNGLIDTFIAISDDTIAYDYSYYSGSNRLQNIPGMTSTGNNFEYTPSGSLKKDDILDHFLYYNLHEQLSKRARIFEHGTKDVKFWYNTDGQRILKRHHYYTVSICQDTLPPPWEFMSFSGPSTECLNWQTDYRAYYYFGGQLHSEYDYVTSATLEGNYVYLNGERVAKLAGNGNAVRYYLNDHLGSVVATVDSSGSLKNWYQHEPYGKQHRAYAPDEIDFGFNGHVLDEELSHDLYYYGARYYDPHYKLFTSVDPMRDKYSNWGPYVYTLSNPVKYIDPDGRDNVFVAGHQLDDSNYPEESFSEDFVDRIQTDLDDWDTYFAQGSTDLTKSWSESFNLGYDAFDEDEYIDRLDKDDLLNVFTHSQGSPWGEGFVAAALDNGFKVGIVAHFAPYQGEFSNRIADVPINKRFSVTHRSDLPFTMTPVEGSISIKVGEPIPLFLQLSLPINLGLRTKHHVGIKNVENWEYIWFQYRNHDKRFEIPE